MVTVTANPGATVSGALRRWMFIELCTARVTVDSTVSSEHNKGIALCTSVRTATVTVWGALENKIDRSIFAEASVTANLASAIPVKRSGCSENTVTAKPNGSTAMSSASIGRLSERPNLTAAATEPPMKNVDESQYKICRPVKLVSGGKQVQYVAAEAALYNALRVVD